MSNVLYRLAPLVTLLRRLAMVGGGMAVLLAGLLYFKQNDLIYPRFVPADARTNVPTPGEFGMSNWEEVSILTPDGETLKCFFIRSEDPVWPKKERIDPITILMFHGNAGNIGHRVPIAAFFTKAIPCNVLMVGYRGYGHSTGKPSEKGLKLDAQAAIDWCLENEEVKDNKIVLYGQSIGGALAIHTAANNQEIIKGLILENTFRSMRILIPSAFPPAKYLASLCHQTWNSEVKIQEITTIPILFLSGLKDELVPPSHMAHLFEVCKAAVKKFKTLPDGDHNDSVNQPEYWNHIYAFLSDDVYSQSNDKESKELSDRSLRRRH